MQHMILKHKNKSQGTLKIQDELELQKTLRGEEERKKPQDERTINNWIKQYAEQKQLKGKITIADFLKQAEQKCREQYQSLPEEEFTEKMKEMKIIFKYLK